MNASLRTHEQIVLAHHIIPTLYAHWPPNDLRGSGSEELRDPKFAALGPIHHGRKPAHLQPSRQELRAYHKQVEPLLNHELIWIDRGGATRQVVADAIGKVVRSNKYTVYACAICSNHFHIVIRRHRDDYQQMWENLTAAIAASLRSFLNLNANHPVFAERPYSVYLYTPHDIETRVEYVEGNPEKEGFAQQHFDFVVPYDGWPFAKKKN